VLKILFFLILSWCQLSFSASTYPIGVLPPEIIPEREYGYLQRSVYQFLQNQLNITSEILFVSTDLPHKEKFSKVLQSRINFLSAERVRIELNLQEVETGRSMWTSVKEVPPEHFWTTLGQEVERLRKTLMQSSPAINKPVENPPRLVLSSFKGEDSPSFFSRLNPLPLISRLFPKKEEPLKIKVEIPPPPPPPGYNIPQVSPIQREAIRPEVRYQPLPAKEASPWQWW